MKEYYHIQSSFNAGEFSPFLLGHFDAPRRNYALRKCMNFIPVKQGPVIKRNGSNFVTTLKDDNKKCLISFIFNKDQAYLLELGDKYIRFYYNNGIILEDHKLISSCYYEGGTTFAVENHGFITGDYVYIESNKILEQEYYKVEVVTDNEIKLTDIYSNVIIELNIKENDLNLKIAKTYEISSPYKAEDLFDENNICKVKYLQSADILYLVHPNYPPYKLGRRDHNKWDLEKIEFKDGPYEDINRTDITIRLSNLSGNITLYASEDLFTPNNVGQLIRIKGNNYGNAVITEFIDAKTAAAKVIDKPDSSSATTNWQFGLFSKSNGYPSSIGLLYDRLIFAGVKRFPQKICFSATSDYYNFAPGDKGGEVLEDGAFNITLNSPQLNIINWIKENNKSLFIGTTGAIWNIKPISENKGFNINNIEAVKLADNSTSSIGAINVNKDIIFTGRNNRKIYINNSENDYEDNSIEELTLFAEHLLQNNIVKIIYQNDPFNIIWALREDGILVGITFDKSQKIIAFHYHEMAGAGTKIIDIAVLPVKNNDRLWLVLKRNNHKYHYLEYIDFNTDFDSKDYYLDCKLSYKFKDKVSKLHGLNFLNNQTVTLIIDDKEYKNLRVGNNFLNLPVPAKNISIGYNFEAVITTMSLEVVNNFVNFSNNYIKSFKLKLYKSYNFAYSCDTKNFKFWRRESNYYNRISPLYSGDTDIISLPYEANNKSIIIRSNDSYPLIILALYMNIFIGGIN